MTTLETVWKQNEALRRENDKMRQLLQVAAILCDDAASIRGDSRDIATELLAGIRVLGGIEWEAPVGEGKNG